MITDPEASAFPDGVGTISYGLTIREEFAARAMQSIAGAGATWPSPADMRAIARLSVLAADALIAELNKPNRSVGAGGTG